MSSIFEWIYKFDANWRIVVGSLDAIVDIVW